MEQILNGEIVLELKALAQAQSRPVLPLQVERLPAAPRARAQRDGRSPRFHSCGGYCMPHPSVDGSALANAADGCRLDALCPANTAGGSGAAHGPCASGRRTPGVRRRPSWCGLFARAFAIVAARQPRSGAVTCLFLAHLYEHPESVAAIVVERDWDGEEAPLITHFQRGPAVACDFDARLRGYRACPVQQFPALRRGNAC